MDVIVQSGLGIGWEAWQQLLDDVLCLYLLVAFELAKLLVQMTEEGVHFHVVCEVSATEL